MVSLRLHKTPRKSRDWRGQAGTESGEAGSEGKISSPFPAFKHPFPSKCCSVSQLPWVRQQWPVTTKTTARLKSIFTPFSLSETWITM